MDFTKCRFRGETVHIEDFLMEHPRDEWCELEVQQEDGSWVRPYRFNDPDPVIGTDKNGIPTL